ncbi:MAG: ATP-binding cassette domain-containing protein [Gemmatimonadaceae bacterium]
MDDRPPTTRDGNAINIELVDLTKSFGEHRALDDVSLSIAAGECVAVVGESGSGKTTMLRCINRLIDPDSGSVSINARDIRSMNLVELRRSLGYVPQDGGLMPHWRVLRNVSLVPWLSAMHDADERALAALRMVGFNPSDVASRWPHELSGGQRQRVAMARALAAGQSCLLLDEPFGALDAITRAELQNAFAKMRAQAGFTAILVTHDLREAMSLGDRVAVMHLGKIEQVSSPEDLRANPSTDYVRRLLAYATGLKT